MSSPDELIAKQAEQRTEQAAAAESEPKPAGAETAPAEVEQVGEEESSPESTHAPLVEQEPVPTTSASVVSANPAPVAKPRLLQDIESAMQEDLEDAYRQLPPSQRAAFRAKGEETAAAIRTLVTATHANVKKIFQLLFAWLKMIPGVSRFFLEQEAKLKTDKILAAAEEEKRRGTLT